MTPERLKKIREWDAATSNRDGAQEHRRELLAEVDRLSTARVAANAELVTERDEHARTERYRANAVEEIGRVTQELREAERKLAVAIARIEKLEASR